MAAPHVSGVAAQLLGGDSTLSVARVKELILAAAEVDYIGLSANAKAANTPKPLTRQSRTPNRFLIGGAGIVGLLNRPTSPPSPPRSPPSPPSPPPSPPPPSPPSPPPSPSPPPESPPSPPPPPSPPSSPPSPSPPPSPPSPPHPPPSQPTTIFDFSGGIATGLGWSTGGGDPATQAYAFTKKEGGTTSWSTGPSAGVGGSGSYVYAETSDPRVQGDLFTLAYDGSACSDTGLGVSTVTFYYHMYGATMGELRMTNAAGDAVWSLSGNQGNSWQAAMVGVYSPSFGFERRGSGAGGGELWGSTATTAAVAAASVAAAGAALVAAVSSPVALDTAAHAATALATLAAVLSAVALTTAIPAIASAPAAVSAYDDL
eukprot:scaffold50547_cov49-Phaeocystis_antarctica.AAC.1